MPAVARRVALASVTERYRAGDRSQESVREADAAVSRLSGLDRRSGCGGCRIGILPRMPRPPLSIEVPQTPEVVFAALTDPRYMRGYLYGTEEIAEVSGSLATAGTTFAQRAGMRVQRTGGVVAADPPRFLHLRLVGFGERVNLEFSVRPVGTGSRIELVADVRNGPPVFGRIVDRLTSRIEDRLWRGSLERLRDDLATSAVMPTVGAVYALEGGGRYRIGDVIAADGDHVHLSLRPGWSANPPADLNELRLQTRRLRGYLDLRPLDPFLRTNTVMRSRGSNSLLADGGLGLAHLPMTLGEFHAANPRPLGDAPVSHSSSALVDAWRERGATAFGDTPSPTVGGLFSVLLQAMGVDALGFGVVKLMRQQVRGVHVRVYSNMYVERPLAIDETSLESRPADLTGPADAPPSEPIAIGHIPLRHGTIAAWQPEFIATSLVDPDELIGYEQWKVAKGGFF